MTTRRDFIRKGAGAVGAGMMLPVIQPNWHQAKGATVVEMLRDDLVADDKILVVVELAGGNDPLNTIVPIQQYDTYASFRSRIAIPKDQLLPLHGSATMGLSPNLSAIKPIADAGKFAVIQMCHYPNPNLSHDGSRTIYRLADTSNSAVTRNGWLGRHSALFGNKTNSLDTVGIGGVNPTLYAPGAKIAGIINDAQGNAAGYQFRTDERYAGDRDNQLSAARVMDAAQSNKAYIDLSETTELDALNSADSVAQATAAYQSSIIYPANNNFASGLKLIAKLATANSPRLGTRVFYITQGGYDTHADQINDQPALHRALAEGLKAFYDDIAEHGLADKLLIMIWSEFGRRVADNASNGTDHGQANNIYCVGNRVIGGTYGADPKLTDLQNGNLKNNYDFREVYSTIIQSWFGNSASDAAQILNGSFNNLGFLM